MKKLSLNDVRIIQIQILVFVDEFCKKNNINYWINRGTLIGAIRHKGYIPWDDDIDIGMLRDDYDRFLKLFNTECDLFKSKYKFICPEIDDEFYCSYGKVMDMDTVLYEPDEDGFKSHINIDVFVYDNAPDDENIIKKMYKKRELYHTLYRFQHKMFNNHNSVIRKIIFSLISFVLNFHKSNYYLLKIIKNSKRYANIQTKRVGDFTGHNIVVCDKNVFDDFIDIEFEDHFFKAPVGYDKWLKSFYGNYMELPPVEEQITHHSYIAYSK